MPRPARFSVDDLLDAALATFARDGAAGLTMAAVARQAEAPSGSLYHRFAGRDELVAALWLRTIERFQDEWVTALDAVEDPLDAADTATEVLFAWVDAHPAEARLLLTHHRDDLRTGPWEGEVRHRADLLAAQADHAITRLADALGRDPGEVVYAVAAVPLAAVRQSLRDGRSVPPGVRAAARRAVRAALAPGPPDQHHRR